MCGEHLDDLALDERRVDIEDDKPLGASCESASLDRDVDTVLGRNARQTLAKVGVGSDAVAPADADHQFEAGHRIVGNTPDRIDVAALACEFGRDRSEGSGGHRTSEQDHRVSRRTVPGRRAADLDDHIHADRAHRLLDDVLNLFGVGVDRDHDPERQAVVDDHLLDIEQTHLLRRERSHEDRGDARLVRAGDRDQDRCGLLHRGVVRNVISDRGRRMPRGCRWSADRDERPRPPCSHARGHHRRALLHAFGRPCAGSAVRTRDAPNGCGEAR
ncbi:Uncharacterised protein [Mycobacteroides abscessus subsp. abscessus]|nr:Uncharacterised protein [Mycobacteroides abscessus subsp. abscessus]